MAKINVVKAAQKPQGACVRCRQPIEVGQNRDRDALNRARRQAAARELANTIEELFKIKKWR
jgi:hypothetical protein